jgi:transcriptional regulator with XRE-family HTH domain
MVDYKLMGNRIAKRRNVLGITQAELAEKSEISLSHIGLVERGSTPSIDTMMSLCAALGVTPNYLLLGVDQEYGDDLLGEIKDAVYRCDPKMKDFIKGLIRYCADHEV